MKWNEKTDEQYASMMTVMAGGDNENEAHLTEDDWLMLTGALGDLLDLLTGESDPDYLKAEYGVGIGVSLVPELRNVLVKILAVEEFDNSPILVSEIDHHRLKTGKESLIDFLERKKSEPKE